MADMKADQNTGGELKGIEGKLLGFDKAVAFIRFHKGDDPTEEICMFRPHRLFINGEKVRPCQVRNTDRIRELLTPGMSISADAIPCDANNKKSYSITVAEEGAPTEVTPEWFSHTVWIGEKADPVTNEMSEVPLIEIRNVKGSVSLFNTVDNIGFINFEKKQIEGITDDTGIAQFRTRDLLVNGLAVQAEDLADQKIELTDLTVTFNAVFAPYLREFVGHESGQEGDGMAVETRWKPTWKCLSVWIGSDPNPEELKEREDALVERIKSSCQRNRKKEFKQSIKGCEYVCGRLHSIPEDNLGIIEHKNRAVLFSSKHLTIDGDALPDSDSLHTRLAVGDELFAYIKKLEPGRKFGDLEVKLEAVQIWKGKRTKTNVAGESALEHERRQRREDELAIAPGVSLSSLPAPSKATHRDMSGETLEVGSAHLGKAIITSGDLKGQRVLFSRNRTYVNGTKLRFRDSLQEIVKQGDVIHFDMMKADESRADGEYEFMALLAWIGEKPSSEAVQAEISQRQEQYRAKIIKFDVRDPAVGYTSGVLQVTGGSRHIGEKVIFDRAVTYVFGTSLAKADLAYIMKENDKVQLEIENIPEEELHIPKQKYKADILLRATVVWIGYFPAKALNNEQTGVTVLEHVVPFLAKRGIDPKYFEKIVSGEAPPREITEETAGAEQEELPNQLTGHIIELKRPDPGSTTGTEHGILQIDSGRFVGQKAFVNRNAMVCWGFNLAKADLMHMVRKTDRYYIEVKGGTNNKSIPFKVTSAWVGPKPNGKTKSPADTNAGPPDPALIAWLKGRDLDYSQFLQCVLGTLPVKRFFPLPLEVQNARIVHLYSHKKTKPGTGCEYGILKIFQGSHAKKGIIFERDNLYVWNVHINTGDLRHLVREGDKVFCEVVEIVGKDKKKWQTRLQAQHVPKYEASLVFIGGGRPKAAKIDEPLEKNANIREWLNKRNKNLQWFQSFLNGEIKPLDQPAMQNQPLLSDMGDVMTDDWPPKSDTSSSLGGQTVRSGDLFENPVMRQAENMLHRVMLCASPEDPAVRNIIKDESEIQLALFIAKSLTSAVTSFRAVRPIGPPRDEGRQAGLYGLPEPLLTSYPAADRWQPKREPLNVGTWTPIRARHPRFNSEFGGDFMEPPYKRKFQEW